MLKSSSFEYNHKGIMEPDRFQQNHLYYVIGLICLVSGVGLFIFSAYLLPYVLFHWHYSMPNFVLNWMSIFKTEYQWTDVVSSSVLFAIFFIPALILVVIADLASNWLDAQIYGIRKEKSKENKAMVGTEKESSGLVLKMILIMIAIFLVAELFQWLITTTPS